MELIGLIGLLATALGVIVAARRLFLTKRQAITQFEGSMAQEYGEIIWQVSYQVLSGIELDSKVIERLL